MNLHYSTCPDCGKHTLIQTDRSDSCSNCGHYEWYPDTNPPK